MREFEYKITSKNNVTIVNFSGKINKESKPQLQACREELVSHTSSMVIFYCKDVTVVEPCVFRELTMLQHEIRQKRIELYVAGLDSTTKQYLVDRAVIRLDESKKTLLDVFEHKKKQM
jgi:anti-anti-sigma regulatory factor